MHAAIVSRADAEHDVQPVKWPRALGAGLIVGAVFLVFFSRGLPWASSGLVSFTVMGRELKSPGLVGGGINFAIVGLHMLSAVIYALIVIPIIHRLRPAAALIGGALMGIPLYFVNMMLFTRIFDTSATHRELHPFITHVAFCALVAAYYKGQTRRRVPISEVSA